MPDEDPRGSGEVILVVEDEVRGARLQAEALRKSMGVDELLREPAEANPDADVRRS